MTTRFAFLLAAAFLPCLSWIASAADDEGPTPIVTAETCIEIANVCFAACGSPIPGSFSSALKVDLCNSNCNDALNKCVASSTSARTGFGVMKPAAGSTDAPVDRGTSQQDTGAAGGMAIDAVR
jgi:hypothetical protein